MDALSNYQTAFLIQIKSDTDQVLKLTDFPGSGGCSRSTLLIVPSIHYDVQATMLSATQDQFLAGRLMHASAELFRWVEDEGIGI
jgi:hypothetical protein